MLFNFPEVGGQWCFLSKSEGTREMKARSPSWLEESALCSAEQILLALYTASPIYIANALEPAEWFCVPEVCRLFEDTIFTEDEKDKIWKRRGDN